MLLAQSIYYLEIGFDGAFTYEQLAEMAFELEEAYLEAIDSFDSYEESLYVDCPYNITHTSFFETCVVET